MNLIAWSLTAALLPALGAVAVDSDDASHPVDDGRPDVAEAMGPRSGQIIVDPDNPQYFKYHEGGPFFMCGPGDPEGFLYRGSREGDGSRDGDQFDLIDKLRDTGANCLYLMVNRSHGGDGGSNENPFYNADPGRSLDDDILDQWEDWFDEMEEAGIVIFLILYDDDQCIDHPDWDTDDEVGEKEADFIDEIVDRFKNYKLLIWCIKEEFQESMSNERAEAIAARIRSRDTRNHPIAIHQLQGVEFEFPDSDLIDQFGVQYNVSSQGALHDGALAAIESSDGRKNVNMAEFDNAGSGRTLREKVWAIGMAGAYMMLYEMDVDSSDPEDLEACGHLVRFMEATEFNRMENRDDLARSDTDYVLADPGRSYIAYGRDVSNRLGIRMEEGTYDELWYDPETGIWYDEGTVNTDDETTYFYKPSGIDDQAALYLAPTSEPGCPEDLDGSGRIDAGDIIRILTQWGPCSGSCTGDVTGNGVVDVRDILHILPLWGDC